jgi:hypothetical protein
MEANKIFLTVLLFSNFIGYISDQLTSARKEAKTFFQSGSDIIFPTPQADAE